MGAGCTYSLHLLDTHEVISPLDLLSRELPALKAFTGLRSPNSRTGGRTFSSARDFPPILAILSVPFKRSTTMNKESRRQLNNSTRTFFSSPLVTGFYWLYWPRGVKATLNKQTLKPSYYSLLKTASPGSFFHFYHMGREASTATITKDSPC